MAQISGADPGSTVSYITIGNELDHLFRKDLYPKKKSGQVRCNLPWKPLTLSNRLLAGLFAGVI
jgi:hypothetical protein